MFNERREERRERQKWYDSLVLLGTFLCGMSAAVPDAHAASTPRATESLQPLTPEQLKEVAELKESSPLARAIDAVPDSIIRKEGYQGDIRTRKERAKSQIPLLYGVRWAILPGAERAWSDRPNINVEIFTRGAYMYFEIPVDSRLQEFGFTRSDMEKVASDIQENISILTDMPARRVNRREDANLVVYFNDQPHEGYFQDEESRMLRKMIPNGYATSTASRISFFPLGDIYEIKFIEPDDQGGAHILLKSEWKDKIAEYLAKIPMDEKTKKLISELGKVTAQNEIVYTAIHEVAHFLGYGHSNEKGQITSFRTYPQWTVPQKASGKKPVILEGASVYIDEDGEKYYFAPGWGDIRKSPLVDMNFFLRIFAKQNKERQLMEERNKQNKE